MTQDSNSNRQTIPQQVEQSTAHNDESTLVETLFQPTIALLPGCDLFEDFFDTIGVSIETYCKELTGGWQFKYIESLKMVGVRTIVIFFSARVHEPTHFTHLPTDTLICVLPPSKPYRLFRAILQRLKLLWKSFRKAPGYEEESNSLPSSTNNSGTRISHKSGFFP